MYRNNKMIECVLENAQKVVFQPSNVYTIDNPDILFVANGNLFGLFIPSKSEIRNVDLLIRRIMVSRLAYVENMKVLLLLEDVDFLHNNFRLLEQICHRILTDTQDCQWMFRSGNFESNIPHIGARIRAKQNGLYARNLRTYELGLKERQNFSTFPIDKRFEEKAVAESWSQSRISVKDAYMVDDCFIAFKRKTKMTFKETFNNLMTLSFFMNYSIRDEGISYKKIVEYPKLINCDFPFIRENNNDPYKYIRVLAFMGLTPITVNSLDACFSIRNQLRQKWQKPVNPRKRF